MRRRYLFFIIFAVSLFFISGCHQKPENYCEVDDDCLQPRYVGSYYCKNNDVHRTYEVYGCDLETHTCEPRPEEHLISDCSNATVCVAGNRDCQLG